MSGAVKIQVWSELVASSHARDTGFVYCFVFAISNNIILCFGFLCAVDNNSISSVGLITIDKRGDLNSLNSFGRNDNIICRL